MQLFLQVVNTTGPREFFARIWGFYLHKYFAVFECL